MNLLVRRYDTGAVLGWLASDELVAESEQAEPTGAVPAYRDEQGTWQYVQPSQVDTAERCGHEVITVYVEANS